MRGVDPVELRHVTIPDLREILEQLDDFWGGERDMGFLHQALYVHEFGETSVLAERDGRILGYLLGFTNDRGIAYIHAVAVRGEAQREGLGRQMYERFEELASGQGALALKAITAPENRGSRAFHEALGFSVEEVGGYSPSGGARLVFRKPLGDPVEGSGREVDLGDGLVLRPIRLSDAEALHATIEENREHIGRWLPFAGQPFSRTSAYVERAVAVAAAGRGLTRVIVGEGRIVGAISFVDISTEHGTTQLGYWVAKAAEGRGLVTRAVSEFIEDAFGPWGLRRVEIRAAANNERSRAVPRRLGFREEGCLRDGHTVGGTTHDEAIYGLLPADPRPSAL